MSNLPPPTTILERQTATSGTSSPIITSTELKERNAINVLKVFLAQLKKNLEECEQAQLDDSLSHDEMAALDQWWNELDGKINAIEDFFTEYDKYRSLYKND